MTEAVNPNELENKITLKFDSNIKLVAGYDYGKSVFESQASAFLDLSKPFYIEFPDSVNVVVSSFVRGFFFEIKKKIGPELFKERVNIICEKDSVRQDVLNAIYRRRSI